LAKGGRKARPITDVTNTGLGKEEMAYACRLFRTNSFKDGAMWHVGPLLGNDGEVRNYRIAVAK
jgi:hypothetical protein